MFTTRPEITGTFGVAASTHWLASQTALGILERGGNAFDAAVAAGFVLQVVEPHLSGPGGEVPVMLWSAREKRVVCVNGQGWAPAAATPRAFKALGFEHVPGIGLLAATAPGAFSGWLTVLARYGSMGLSEVLGPAIRYARDGFPVAARMSQAILAVRELFATEWTSSAGTWLVDGKVPRPGSLHTLPHWAATLQRVVEEAQGRGSTRVQVIEAAMAIWQRGFVAREIDRFCTTASVRDSSGERHGGLLRFEDMAEWAPAVEVPATLDFDRYTVAKFGFASQGPTLLQQLALLKHANLQACAPDSAAFVHRIAEAAKLAFADRLAWYGSAGHANPQAQQALLTDAYARQRWGDHRMTTAANSLEPGSPLGLEPRLPDLHAALRTAQAADTRFGVGEPTFANLPPAAEWVDREIFVGDTCHIDVIDREGNMVAATPSGGWLSSSPTIPSLGFALGTRLQAAWLDDGLPNTLTPRVAPCITLSPSLALRDGEPYLAFGTPGGDQQDQWATAFFLRHVVHGLNLQEAIDSPAWHVTHYPSSFWPRLTKLNTLTLESRFSSEAIEQLGQMGHRIEVGDPWSEGRLSACSQTRDSKGRLILRAAANPRGMQGYAVGR